MNVNRAIPRQARALALFLAGSVSCGSPTSPSLPILQGPGPHRMELIGFAISSDPEFPPCLPPVTVFTAARLRIDVTEEGGFWVGRSPSGIGDLELRIRGDEELIGGTQVSGSISGTQMDNLSSPAADVSVRFGGSAASVTGTAERTGQYVRGKIAGDIQYFNSAGNVTRCTSIFWSLQPASS